MFGLKVDTPFNRILEFLSGLLKQLNCFGISHSAKVGVYDIIQSCKQSLVHK